MTVIVSDIGGTHIRFAMVDGGELTAPDKFAVAGHDGIEDALKDYCSQQNVEPKGRLLIATASCPEKRKAWTFSNNNHWTIDPDKVEAAGWKLPVIVSDFSATARGMMATPDDKKITLKEGVKAPHLASAILGPGTGLGLAYAIPLAAGGFHIQHTFGGHMLAAALTSEQHAVLKLVQRFKTQDTLAIPEDVASGRALPNLYKAVCIYHGRTAQDMDAGDMLAHADDVNVKESLRLFHEFLGLFAHNAVVTMRAGGGIYLDGGVFHKLYETGLFDLDSFMKYFVLDPVPVVKKMLEDTSIYTVSDPYIALRGLLEMEKEIVA